MYAIFFILFSFYVLGLSPLQLPQSFLGCLAQERSAQSVNKMWIELSVCCGLKLVFVPESLF
jgi:thiol:disulfide interchange protein